MGNRASANILFVFALGISVCLLYSAEFISFRKVETLDGLTCPEDATVFSLLSIMSNIHCSFQCSRYGTCVVAFYKPSKKKCVGCNTSSKENMVTEDEYIGYVLDKSCGILPSIDNGNYTLDPGTNTATLICGDKFRASTDTIRCQPNGTWETATCEEYDCYLTTSWEYRGKRNTTFSMQPCLRWDSPLFDIRCETKPCPEPREEAENYCRNPKWGIDDAPYCIAEYTDNNPDKYYENHCGILKC
ncbi:uncharacterized protein LOC132757869 [Ruditapes philippinarum]|uniref:uncharacterized protein LOC132757869 n=1 Tax=Ruditapes philippinarum TaxID=129788 RepID=UPI00295AD458|nr:uncharacterized protein LOC132757869 [Ruditapes philippinarum]